MGTFILLLFIFFIVIPLAKVLWKAYLLHRQWNKATRGMRDAFNQTRQQASQSASSHQRRNKKKKIDPNVGEYVAFEEIACNTTTQTASQDDTAFRSEPQVEDAVWEDIK